jgi:AcrR family transcriptional regulator
MNSKKINEKDDNTRKKILDTAAALFAQKGYDGSRVDEISERIGVTKALIYYYFESKEKILEEILEGKTKELIREKQRVWEQIDRSKLKDNQSFSNIMDASINQLQENSDIFKIAFMEILKDKQNDALFKMVDTLYLNLISIAKEKGVNLDFNEIQISGFFFGLAPMLSAAIFGEKWAEYHHIDVKEFNEKFSVLTKEVFSKIFGDLLK